MTNTLYTGDNLYILNGMNSESVDLIYLDPPFNSKRIYSAPVGSKSAGASFKDMWSWQDIDEYYLEGLRDYPLMVEFIHSIDDRAMKAYITYMAQRLVELHRVLKSTGSIYLHIDQTASHYLKVTMDKIFGKNNFRNEIVWQRSPIKGAKATSRQFGRNIDTILFYTKDSNYIFDQLYKPYDLESKHNKFKFKDSEGRIYSRDNPLGDYSEARINQFEAEGKIYTTKTGGKQLIRYLDEQKGLSIGSIWEDIKPINQVSKERTGYPTQKPLTLLHRIIKTSCPKDGIVFDPFCGCATAMVAAQQLNRSWIGIDIEAKAADILVQRLSDDAGFFKDFIHTADIPQRTDIVEIPVNDTPLKERLYKEQRKACNGCETEMDIQHFEVDHIIPQSKGGGNYYENYQLLCGNCNRIKGNRPMEYLRLQISERHKHLKYKTAFGD